ncbi:MULTISPECIES: GNAT family N-acetyltransferase [Staphylococcus]|uniref:GCN5-related N-acetyltransferase n=1 Tax=Staphylococcus hsinchuensis TaxID=3051183 RepID=A0ABZ3EA88_9STAP|nr:MULTISPECIES: GNAT family N-acetyltransferase [unclassified Staphylococcus]
MFQKVTTNKMLEDAFEVRKKVFVEEQGVPLENELDAHDKTSTHFIGYEENIPFATGRLRAVDDKAKIERVAITKQFRKSGNGKKLMNFIEQYAKDEGFSKVTLNAQCQAQKFYETLGYQAEGSVFMEENIEHIVMSKKFS